MPSGALFAVMAKSNAKSTVSKATQSKINSNQSDCKLANGDTWALGIRNARRCGRETLMELDDKVTAEVVGQRNA